jgi:hypothetical protein
MVLRRSILSCTLLLTACGGATSESTTGDGPQSTGEPGSSTGTNCTIPM